jgi:hypothetical protein
MKVLPTPQGNLNPTSVEELEERNEEKNPWAQYVIEPIPTSRAAATTTSHELQKMVENNLCCMEYYVNGQPRFVDAFFIKSNIALVPDHIFEVSDFFAVFTRHGKDKVGGNFKSHISTTTSAHIPDTDLRLIWVPSGGDWKDLTKYYPLEKVMRAVPGILHYKAGDGSVMRSGLKCVPQMIQVQDSRYWGGAYDLEFPTFPGLCMATIVANTRAPIILGHHLGGKTNATFGVCGMITLPQIEKAIEVLKQANVLLCASSGTMPTQQYGVQFFEGAEMHPKSPVNYMEPGGSMRIYGSVKGRCTYYSEVVQTKISPIVHEVTGTPNLWGAPKMRPSWKPFQASLASSSNPSCGVEPLLLNAAVADYLSDIMLKLKEFPHLKKDIRPLTEMENVCGIDGKKFIDKIPPNTSVGYPLGGPKRDYLTDLNPDDYPGFACPRELDPIFWEEMKRCEDTWSLGERVYPVFKGCLKDEPTKLTKDKVRVFQAAPIALQLAVRKYFLPVARMFSLFPLISECAVGVNAHGPEWGQLADHMRKYGEDRILAGDYKTYDLRMPAQLTLMAFKIMIDVARECGYDARSLAIMESIATEIAYPCVAYNGDLLTLIGSNPSGQNMTVYVNSIDNSLLLRCAYYSILGLNAPAYRSVCGMMTYGDDFKGSVKPGFDEYNHVSVAKWMADHDIILTMPDKTSTPIPFMHDSAADFLKRKNVYAPKLDRTVAALDESSILKSLHSCLKSKVISDDEHDMQAIDGALREWFFHGEEVYETRRAQMQEIAEKAGIKHGCSEIHISYDEKIKLWKEKYESPEES